MATEPTTPPPSTAGTAAGLKLSFPDFPGFLSKKGIQSSGNVINDVHLFEEHIAQVFGDNFGHNILDSLYKITGKERRNTTQLLPRNPVKLDFVTDGEGKATGEYRLSASLHTPYRDQEGYEAIKGWLETVREKNIEGITVWFDPEQHRLMLTIVGNDPQAVADKFNQFAQAVLEARGSQIPLDTVTVSLPQKGRSAAG